MSGGKGKSQSAGDPRLNGINVDTSTYGNAIPLLYGCNRAPLALIQYPNFVVTPHTQSQGGGKGGGGGSSNTTYTYAASLLLSIGEGPISGVGLVWQDKAITSLATLGLTLFSGTSGQAPWSYVTSNYPAQADGYDHTAYLAVANYSLGSSAAIPNITVEAIALLSTAQTAISFTGPLAAGATGGTLSAAQPNGVLNITFSTHETRACTIVGGTGANWTTGLQLACTAAAGIGGLDADPSAILIDYCTEGNHGANFQYLNPLIQGTGVLTYQSYVIAMGFALSPFEMSQRAANDFIKEMLEITNSDAVWSAGLLNIYPYADTSVTGNGRTYTPNLTPLYSFTDDDYLPGSGGAGDDPVLVKRKPTSETYNCVRVEFLDRTNAYNTAIAEVKDDTDIALNGLRVMETKTFHSITTAAVAQTVAQLILQRQLYIRNTFVFSVRCDYCLLESMDLVSITDANLGIVNKLVRLTEVEDDENDVLTFTAEDMLVGSASAPQYNWQASQGYAANYAVLPPSVGTPLIFNGPPLLVSANGGYELWIEVDQGAAGSWGGCDVYMSLDNISYIFAGTVNGAGRYGTLTATLPMSTDPDTTNTLSVALTNPSSTTLQITSGSAADYANLRTLLFVDGEIMAYQTATLTGAGTYNLTTLRRGLYGSVASSHAAGSQFARIDAGTFRVPFDVGMMGQTVYFKFASFNALQKSYQSLAACTAYSHVLSNVNAGQNMPGALTLIGSGVTTASNTAFKSAQTAAVWDSSCYTAQSYNNGCMAQAFASQTTCNVMFGLTLNPSASNSYTNLAYAWMFQSNGSLLIYESGTLIGNFGAYTTSDLLSIAYDGKHIVYYHNGAIVRSVPIANLSLYMQLCFYDIGGSVYGIDFTNQAPVSIPLTLLNFNANSACVGTTAHKVANTNAWDTAAYSSQPYTNGCALSCTQAVLTAGNDMFGLTLNPTASVSYSNLAYGFNLIAGTWSVYESGAVVAGITGTYTSSTVFEITHDGKHVAYYAGGTLVRSVPVNNATFYMQVCLCDVGDVISNINWGPLSAAVTPFTLVPMTSTVACVGTRAASTALGAVGFGTKCFRSQECFANGVIASASVAQLLGALYFGFATAPATGASPMLAGWYPHGDSSDCEIIFGGTSLGSYGATPTLSDVFTVSYDNFNFYWYRNNTLILQKAYPNAGPLYLFGDFYGAGYGFNNISFLPFSPATPQSFIARGFCTVADTSITKQGGSSTSWTDSDAYSINGYTTCHLVWKASQTTGNFMGGLASGGPPASINYTGINYAIFLSSAGTWTIYELGTATGVTGSYVTTDFFAVTYDGATLTYWKDGVSLRTVSVAGLTLFADFVLYQNTISANSIEFGPGATVPILDTGQINAGAVTTAQIGNAAVTTTQIATNAVNPSAGQLAAKGSTAPIVLGAGFTYTSTTSTVTISWVAFSIYRPDGTSVAIGAGSFTTITGLSSSTTYKVYAYYDESLGMSIVSGGSGTPSNCFASAGNAVAAQQMNLNSHVALGGFAVTTPSSGSGGGGGGNGVCVGAAMWLSPGTQAKDATIGAEFDCLDLPSGAGPHRRQLQGLAVATESCVRLTSASAALICSVSTPFDLPDGRAALAPQMLGEQVQTDQGIETITGLEYVGPQPVIRLSFGGVSFAAGEDPLNRIYSHNGLKP